MTVRKLGPDDAHDLQRVLELFRGYNEIDPDPFLADSAAVAFVAEANEKIVGWAYGYLLTRPEGASAFLLYEIEVVTNARRRGHGAALIAACLAEADRHGCQTAWVLTETAADAAIDFYRATGASLVAAQAMLSWPLSRKVD